MLDTSEIKAYHLHVYFDAETIDFARAICEAAGDLFGVGVGHVFEKNIGPHPRWSCQLSATPDQFAAILPWLALNREDLIVFCHPVTGQHLEDHRDRGIWLGTGLELDLSFF
jgi:aromatic ring-cleaving dioxygenase